jgi:hypothetical protein
MKDVSTAATAKWCVLHRSAENAIFEQLELNVGKESVRLFRLRMAARSRRPFLRAGKDNSIAKEMAAPYKKLLAGNKSASFLLFNCRPVIETGMTSLLPTDSALVFL